MWNSIVSVPDHCVFIYFKKITIQRMNLSSKISVRMTNETIELCMVERGTSVSVRQLLYREGIKFTFKRKVLPSHPSCNHLCQ